MFRHCLSWRLIMKGICGGYRQAEPARFASGPGRFPCTSSCKKLGAWLFAQSISLHVQAVTTSETGGEMPSWGALAGRTSLGVVMLVMQCCTGDQLWLLLCSLPAVRGTQGYVALSWVIYSLSSKCVLGVGGSCNEIKCPAQETCSGTEN